MKNLTLFIYSFLFFYLTSNAQIDKGFWIQGGNVALVFDNSKITSSSSNYDTKEYYLVINPNVGYFIIDRLAIGTSLNIELHYFPVEDYSSYGIDIGPFIRYYYLNHNKPYNFFSQIGYNYGIGLDEKFEKWVDVNKITINNGFSYFLNESVAIEASINYHHRKFEETNSDFKSISNNFNLSI
mgnify:FL=1